MGLWPDSTRRQAPDVLLGAGCPAIRGAPDVWGTHRMSGLAVAESVLLWVAAVRISGGRPDVRAAGRRRMSGR